VEPVGLIPFLRLNHLASPSTPHTVHSWNWPSAFPKIENPFVIGEFVIGVDARRLLFLIDRRLSNVNVLKARDAGSLKRRVTKFKIKSCF
jgi:hypothetical protein